MISFSGITSTASFELRDASGTALTSKSVKRLPQDLFATTVPIDPSFAQESAANAHLLALFNTATRDTCFDGGDLTSNISGTLRIGKAICIRNANFVQAQAPPSTLTSGNYILTAYYQPDMDLGSADSVAVCVPQDGATSCSCDQPASPTNQIKICDPRFSDVDAAAVNSYLNIRTLNITPSGPDRTVRLENVTVNRGTVGYGSEGMGGLWIENANPLNLKNVDISGPGMGKGVLINNSINAVIDGLKIHDIVWAPFPGDRALDYNELKQKNYNHASTYLYDSTNKRFVRTRTRENVIGLQIMSSHHVEILNSSINDVGVTLPGMGTVAIQADGFDVLSVSDLNFHDSSMRNTWEGADFGFAGVDPAGALCNLENVTVSNTFGAAFKFRGDGHTSCTLSHLNAPMTGYTGFLMGGSYTKLPGNYNRIYGYDLKTSDVGYYSFTPPGQAAVTTEPWIHLDNPSNFRWVTIAGFEMSYTDEPAIDAYLQHVSIINNTVDNPRPLLDGFSCVDFAASDRRCAANHPSYLLDSTIVGARRSVSIAQGLWAKARRAVIKRRRTECLST